MTFEELKRVIISIRDLPFQTGSDRLLNMIFNLGREDTLELISQIGAIPEEISHDSTEEKLYTKASDILLAKSLNEMGLTAKVLTQRGNCADIIAQSLYHNYSLVGDAKAFRLSRTAKNVKDFKVSSMALWKGESDYSVLVCPYFQYPAKTSQIYQEALTDNVALFSWEYLYIFLKEGIRETPSQSLAELWNQSEIISRSTTVADAHHCFLSHQDSNICRFIGLDNPQFYLYLKQLREIITIRGYSEIDYYEREIERVTQLNREAAIAELLKYMKLENKIGSIRNFIGQIHRIDLNP